MKIKVLKYFLIIRNCKKYQQNRDLNQKSTVFYADAFPQFHLNSKRQFHPNPEAYEL